MEAPLQIALDVPSVRRYMVFNSALFHFILAPVKSVNHHLSPPFCLLYSFNSPAILVSFISSLLLLVWFRRPLLYQSCSLGTWQSERETVKITGGLRYANSYYSQARVDPVTTPVLQSTFTASKTSCWSIWAKIVQTTIRQNSFIFSKY